MGHGTSRASGTRWSSIRVSITGSTAQEVSKGIRQATRKAVLILRRQRCFDFIEFLPDPAAGFFERPCAFVSLDNGGVERGIQFPKSPGGFFVGLGGCNSAISLADNFVDPRNRLLRSRFLVVPPRSKPTNDNQNADGRIQIQSL
jgi:hypothetical protein